MKLSEVLYDSTKEIWDSYCVHPFVSGIGDGTLPKEAFRFYMVQDYLYLLQYAKVFALGVVKATDEDVMRVFAGLVGSVLNDEMDTHNSYISKLGISKKEISKAKVSFANKAYTDYMLWESQNGSEIEILVSILSCSWSYFYIGNHLFQKNPSSADHEFYGEWISSYVSDEYKASNDRIIELVDRLGAGLTDEHIKKLIDIFVNCSRFEYLFWDMAYNMDK